MVVKLKVLLVDQLLDGCGDGILQAGFCMSVGEGGTEWVNRPFAYMCMHFTCASKTNARTHISRVVINAFEQLLLLVRTKLLQTMFHYLLCEHKPWYILVILFTYLWRSEQKNLDGSKSGYICPSLTINNVAVQCS